VYCEVCGELVEESKFGVLVHAYRLGDSHVPTLED
jgi:hypothetical protein